MRTNTSRVRVIRTPRARTKALNLCECDANQALSTTIASEFGPKTSQVNGGKQSEVKNADNDAHSSCASTAIHKLSQSQVPFRLDPEHRYRGRLQKHDGDNLTIGKAES